MPVMRLKVTVKLLRELKPKLAAIASMVKWGEETGPSRGNRNKKTRGDIIADITSLRGRLPTLPLSQYHRRGEA